MKKIISHNAALFIKFALASAVCLSPISAPLAASKIYPTCPASVQESAIKVQNVPVGWVSYVARPMYLSGAAPTDGPPQQKGELVNDSERRKKNETTYIYHLDGPYPEGKWLECSYGGYGEIALAKKLADSITRCAFTYKKGQKAGQSDIKIECE